VALIVVSSAPILEACEMSEGRVTDDRSMQVQKFLTEIDYRVHVIGYSHYTWLIGRFPFVINNVDDWFARLSMRLPIDI